MCIEMHTSFSLCTFSLIYVNIYFFFDSFDARFSIILFFFSRFLLLLASFAHWK